MLKRILSAVTALLIVASAWTVVPNAQYGNASLTANALKDDDGNEYIEYGYEGFRYWKYNDHAVVTGYNSPDAIMNNVKSLNIPAEIDGLPVTAIGDNAFYDYPVLTDVTIPDSVTSIGDYAFFKCNSLPSVTIPDGVVSIGEGAFTECEKLSTIIMPESVAEIGEGAFFGCPKLTEITILAPNCKIYDNANTISHGFKNIDGDYIPYYEGIIRGYENSTAQEYAEKWGYTFEALEEEYTEGMYEFLTYRKYADHIVISDCHWEAESVIIPAEIEGLPVTEIGREAFVDCLNLTSILIPDSVSSIDRGAFLFCSNLTEITIPDSVNKIGAEAFSGCYSLSKITLPDGIKSISDSTFENCFMLSEIVIPDSVKTIGYRAFSYCDNLAEIRIPNNVTSIGNNAFCYCKKLSEVTLSDSLTKIGEFAFSWCSSISEITVPNSVTSIEYYAFGECTNLSSVTILNPDCEIYNDYYTIINDYDENHKPYYNGIIRGYENSTAQAYAEKYGYTFEPIADEYTEGTYENLAYKKYADHIVISDCDESAKSVDIPAEIDRLPVTVIGDSAFEKCFDLTSVTIPNSVTSIGELAFGACKNLVSLTIPDSVTEIGKFAFNGCSALEKITLSDNITSIKPATFELCESLTEITIPESVTLIDELAFHCCKSLNEIIILNSDCEIYDYAGTISNDFTNNPYGYYFNGIIRGYENSTAQAYAEKYGYKFEVIGSATEQTITYGDANCDGVVTIADATTILQHLGNKDKYALSEQGEINADVDETAGITANDAIVIQQVDAGLVSAGALPLRDR